MSPTHPFDAAIQLDVIDDNTFRGRTDPEWDSMVGPFGGITVAALLRAVASHPARIGDPVALTVNFAAPIAKGDFDISLRAARTNHTNQHWIAELRQDGDIKTTATALFGVHRDTWADTEARPPSAPPPEQLARDSVQQDFVGWARLYDLRFVEGAFPGEGAQRSSAATTTMWMRDRARRRIDYPALATLCDIFCPRAFLRCGGPIPAGTISLTSYFHADQAALDALGDGFVLGTAHANRFFGGYFDQSAQLWTRDGVLLASSHQIVYFKGDACKPREEDHVRQRS
ncbi:acyl-CoA thioesterase [Mycobacterium florentinum]|uniref:Acyl-CoA thioesterase n=1 Tax=Mycobacterium florentinum TaxID=292462 RepID=A0A1X1UDL6_MYCFL|nr:thioesterase family protein [Mycobacterium florentinum]MCV7412097.1 thioesterase family protein [Mycobacterium florentinum]ORV54927.1 acyl-CoA thioesterase [Mycobacterium florentinum]BBX81472.1 acyl-CoA thioesterase [Mycobacterium florentinum]